MDDCVLWGGSGRTLRSRERECRRFLSVELQLEAKGGAGNIPLKRGLEFLGARVYPDHLKLSRRSRRRFRRKLRDLETELVLGARPAREFQERSSSLLAFVRAGGMKSWRFRQNVLSRLAVSGP